MLDQAFLRDKDRNGQDFKHAMVWKDMDQPAQRQPDDQKADRDQKTPQTKPFTPVPALIRRADKTAHQDGRMWHTIPDHLGFAKDSIKQKGKDQGHAVAISPGAVIRKRMIGFGQGLAGKAGPIAPVNQRLKIPVAFRTRAVS